MTTPNQPRLKSRGRGRRGEGSERTERSGDPSAADRSTEPDTSRALVMTVGIPTDPKVDLATSLANDAKTVRPEEVVLVASSQSLRNARRIRKMLGIGKERCQIIELKSPHDLEDTFRKVNAAIERLRAKGIGPEEIAINFTSGTKMMASGTVLSAVFNRCKELRYLTGAESGAKRQRLIKTTPNAVFASQDLARGLNLMRRLMFSSAQTVLGEIDDSLLTEKGRGVHKSLVQLAVAYAHWENFHPGRFLETYQGVKFNSPLLAPFRLSEKRRLAVAQLARALASQRVGKFFLIELYNNGIRRLKPGSTEDAVTRLYRAMDVLAQWVLTRDFGIDTNDADTRKIPPRDRVAFEAMRSIEDGTVKIGLRKSYDLLMLLDTRVGDRFKESEDLRQLLGTRSTSILAHGMSPIELVEAARYFSAGRDLFMVEIPDFDELSALLQFPWLEADEVPGQVDHGTGPDSFPVGQLLKGI